MTTLEEKKAKEFVVYHIHTQLGLEFPWQKGNEVFM